MLFMTACSVVQPYTEQDVEKYAKEYYGADTKYNDCQKLKDNFWQEKCTDYHFISKQGFNFTITSGVTKARKWIFFVIHIPFLKSDYTNQLINYYGNDLQKIIDASGLDARWQETDAGESFRYTITDTSQSETAAKMIIKMDEVISDDIPSPKENLPVSLVEEIPIYGYTPVEQDEVGVYWGTMESLSNEDTLIQDMTEQYNENYTEMHYGEIPE